MFCTYCGTKVDENYKFCPGCGVLLNPETITNIPPKDQHSSTPDTPQMKKKPMPFWFKIIALLAILALIGVTAGILFTESWVDVVDHQLEALRQGDIPKAYTAYTSKDFQSATSLDQFRSFVEAYPVFHNNKSAHFTQRSIEHNIGIIKGKLTSQEHVNTPIEYKLIKEDGKWKILSIRLLKPENIQNAKETDHAEDLIEAAKSQLKDIQDGKFDEAYKKYASDKFKNATSQEAFLMFVKRYPILSKYRVVSFHKPTIKNGVGTLSVILQSDQIAAYVKYYFIYENNQWKVWSMRILSPSEGENANLVEAGQPVPAVLQMHFGEILLGDRLNEKGEVEFSKSKFNLGLKDLYVDVEVIGGAKGTIVHLSLKHLDSGIMIPAKVEVSESFDSMLLSVFTAPAKGWPKGHYSLTVSTSPNIKKTVEFDIDE